MIKHLEVISDEDNKKHYACNFAVLSKLTKMTLNIPEVNCINCLKVIKKNKQN